VRAAVALLALVACSDGDAEPTLLAGSPDATRALGFTETGTPVAIGGTSTFGLAFLQHQVGDTWIRAELVPGFGTRAQLIGGGTHGPLLALDDITLYRLVDETARSWDGITIPAGASTGTVFGADATGHVYALDLAGGDGNGAVVAWMPGDPRWIEVPGTRPLGPGAKGFIVEADGRVTWFVPDRGIVRVDAGAQGTIIDCHELGDCSVPFTSLAYDDRGALTFLVCSPDVPPRFAIRLAAGATVGQQLPLPSGATRCLGLGASADGTRFLAGVDGTDDGPLARLGPSSASWTRVAAASPGFRYVVRDARSVFAFGDAQPERGVYQIDLD
jgi:outer membrane protein assembly factor BamB